MADSKRDARMAELIGAGYISGTQRDREMALIRVATGSTAGSFSDLWKTYVDTLPPAPTDPTAPLTIQDRLQPVGFGAYRHIFS